MTIKYPRDWVLHGVYEETPLMAGLLPRHGVHSFVGDPGEARDSAMAHLATCVASTPATCAGNGRFELSPCGSASGVAIIAGQEGAERISRAVASSAVERCVRNPIPVAVLGVNGVHLEGIHARINELSVWFEAEYGVGLGLVIFDLALLHGQILQFVRQDRAALVVGNEAPVGADGVVISVKADRLDVAMAAKPVVRKVVAPAPEVPIVDRFVLIVNRGEIEDKVRAKWRDDGYTVVESQQAALPKPGELVGGRREIIVAGDDQLPTELRARATRLREEAVRAGVDKDVTISVAA